MRENYDIVIAGAGISGLSLAHYCVKQGLSTLVIAPEPGGVLCSLPYDDGFWLELGAHSCFNSYGNLIAIMEQHGLLDDLQKRRKAPFKLWRNKGLKGIPGQLHWLELLRSLPRLFHHKKTGLSVAEYFTPIVGERNYREVFSSAFNAVICQPADDFPAEMLFRKKPRRRDVLKTFTFPRGLQTLTDTLARMPGLNLRSGQAVSRIARENGAFVVTAGEDTYRAGHLAIATPADEAARLLREVLPQVAELLSRVATVRVESVGVVVEKQAMRLPLLGGIIGADQAFYSVVSRDTVDHPRYRGFTFHFKPGLLDQAGQDQVMAGVLGTDRWLIRQTRSNLLPAPKTGHPALIAEVDTRLAGQPVLLTGNYFLGVSIEDCVSRSRSEFERISA